MGQKQAQHSLKHCQSHTSQSAGCWRCGARPDADWDRIALLPCKSARARRSPSCPHVREFGLAAAVPHPFKLVALTVQSCSCRMALKAALQGQHWMLVGDTLTCQRAWPQCGLSKPLPQVHLGRARSRREVKMQLCVTPAGSTIRDPMGV